jgi:hypothetical protein
MKKFNFKKYLDDQTVEALTHPINRHAVRVAYGVDDWWLHDHKDVLIMWWIEHGGATEFAKKRKEYEEETDELEKQKEKDSKAVSDETGDTTGGA